MHGSSASNRSVVTRRAAGVALHFVGNTADAADLVQDTLFRASAWDQFAPVPTRKLAVPISAMCHRRVPREARRRQTLSSAPPSDDARVRLR